MPLHLIRLASKDGPYWSEMPEDETSLASLIGNYDLADILGVYEAEKSGQALEDYSLVNVTHEAAKIVWDGLDDFERESPPQFVQQHHPDWQNEHEDWQREAEAMAAHEREMSHQSRYL